MNRQLDRIATIATILLCTASAVSFPVGCASSTNLEPRTDHAPHHAPHEAFIASCTLNDDSIRIEVTRLNAETPEWELLPLQESPDTRIEISVDFANGDSASLWWLAEGNQAIAVPSLDLDAIRVGFLSASSGVGWNYKVNAQLSNDQFTIIDRGPFFMTVKNNAPAKMTIAFNTPRGPVERHLDVVVRESRSLPYADPSDYWTKLESHAFPQSYSMEKKLLLIAHGFDSHVRLTLAARLWDDVGNSESKYDELLSYFDSNDPALAWAAAWTVEKCGTDDRRLKAVTTVYRRADVRAFESQFHD